MSARNLNTPALRRECSGKHGYWKTGGESADAHTSTRAGTLAGAAACPARIDHPAARIVAGLWFDRDHAKQAVGVIIRTGGKKELVGLATVPAVSELNGPELVDDDRLAVQIAQRAEKRAGMGIERVDAAVGNVVGDQ